MNPFALLGLTPDADEPRIKRAYARLLKACRPDEDPVGFQALHEAYADCLRQAREPQAEALDFAAESGYAHPGPGVRADVPAQYSAEGYRFDPAPFFAELDRQADALPARELARWLQGAPELVFSEHRRIVAEALPAYLRRREPPLYLAQLRAVLACFAFAPAFDSDEERREWVRELSARSWSRGEDLPWTPPPEFEPPWTRRFVERWQRRWRLPGVRIGLVTVTLVAAIVAVMEFSIRLKGAA